MGFLPSTICLTFLPGVGFRPFRPPNTGPSAFFTDFVGVRPCPTMLVFSHLLWVGLVPPTDVLEVLRRVFVGHPALRGARGTSSLRSSTNRANAPKLSGRSAGSESNRTMVTVASPVPPGIRSSRAVTTTIPITLPGEMRDAAPKTTSAESCSRSVALRFSSTRMFGISRPRGRRSASARTVCSRTGRTARPACGRTPSGDTPCSYTYRVSPRRTRRSPPGRSRDRPRPDPGTEPLRQRRPVPSQEPIGVRVEDVGRPAVVLRPHHPPARLEHVGDHLLLVPLASAGPVPAANHPRVAEIRKRGLDHDLPPRLVPDEVETLGHGHADEDRVPPPVVLPLLEALVPVAAVVEHEAGGERPRSVRLDELPDHVRVAVDDSALRRVQVGDARQLGHDGRELRGHPLLVEADSSREADRRVAGRERVRDGHDLPRSGEAEVAHERRDPEEGRRAEQDVVEPAPVR